MECWKTDEDVDRDMFTLSEFTDGKKYKPPRTRKVEAKTSTDQPKHKSIYDFDDEGGVDEAERLRTAQRQLISAVGRGYVMQKFRGGVNRSANGMSQQVLDQTARDIREVNPVGYSNELIEAAYRKQDANGAVEGRLSPASDATGGKPKETVSSNASSSMAANDLPADFFEYDTTPSLQLTDNLEFPML